MSTSIPWFRYGLKETLQAYRDAKRKRDTEGAACWSEALDRIFRKNKKRLEEKKKIKDDE